MYKELLKQDDELDPVQRTIRDSAAERGQDATRSGWTVDRLDVRARSETILVQGVPVLRARHGRIKLALRETRPVPR